MLLGRQPKPTLRLRLPPDNRRAASDRVFNRHLPKIIAQTAIALAASCSQKRHRKTAGQPFRNLSVREKLPNATPACWSGRLCACIIVAARSARDAAFAGKAQQADNTQQRGRPAQRNGPAQQPARKQPQARCRTRSLRGQRAAHNGQRAACSAIEADALQTKASLPASGIMQARKRKEPL